MTIVVTGANGFIGRNLMVHLAERGFTDGEVIGICRDTPEDILRDALARAEFVFHLAGVNRPLHEAEFAAGNAEFTTRLCEILHETGHRVPVVFASSTQALQDNAYGRSKRAAEDTLLAYGEATQSPVHIFRLTNVFGKWCRPNYNSVVATFCHNIAHGRDVVVNDASAPLNLVYVDDVVAAFLRILDTHPDTRGFVDAGPVYSTTVGELAETIRVFAQSREALVTPRVGSGLLRALYSTYLTYLDTSAFAYTVPRHGDSRGVFVEMLKTPDCGQYSYFTAHPGITRGEHYHHTKTEKFLVISGKAHFGFRHIATNERHEIVVEGGEGQIVETVPGWTHNITNVGNTELIVMLWANEIFDRERPDTFAQKVDI